MQRPAQWLRFLKKSIIGHWNPVVYSLGQYIRGSAFEMLVRVPTRADS